GPGHQSVSDSDTHTVSITRNASNPHLHSFPTRRSSDLDGKADPGDKVTYSYTVSNNGNVTLTGLTLTDDNGTPGDTSDDKSITRSATTMSPLASTTSTYTRTLIQADIDAGSITNIATAS